MNFLPFYPHFQIIYIISPIEFLHMCCSPLPKFYIRMFSNFLNISITGLSIHSFFSFIFLIIFCITSIWFDLMYLFLTIWAPLYLAVLDLFAALEYSLHYVDPCCTALWDPSFQTRAGTSIPCTARGVLNHWSTREVPDVPFQHIFISENIFPYLSFS